MGLNYSWIAALAFLLFSPGKALLSLTIPIVPKGTPSSSSLLRSPMLLKERPSSVNMVGMGHEEQDQDDLDTSYEGIQGPSPQQGIKVVNKGEIEPIVTEKFETEKRMIRNVQLFLTAIHSMAR